MNPILQVFYSVFSGLILGLALPNELYSFGCPYLVLIALVPLYISIKHSKNYGFAFLSAFLQVGTTHLYSSYWLANFKDFAALTLGASAVATAIIGGIFGLFLYFPFSDSYTRNKLSRNALLYKIKNSTAFKIFYFASLYTLYEWVKSCSFFGYPWATLSSTVYQWNCLMQLASITGTYGITFFLALINVLFVEFFSACSENFRNKNNNFDLKYTFYVTASLLAFILIHGLYWQNKILTPIKKLTTIVVQKNSDPWKEKSDIDNILKSQELTNEQLRILNAHRKPAHLIVWSEGSLRSRFPDAQYYYEHSPHESPLIPFIRNANTPLITGGAFTRSRENKIYFNAAVMFDKYGKYRGIYGKNHLVPFAEAIPGMEYPAIKKFMAKVIGISSGWSPGDQYVLFDIPCAKSDSEKLPAVKTIDLTMSYEDQIAQENENPSVKIATPICYDDAFPDIMRPLFLNGAELYVNLTDDSWSLKKSSEYQHFVVASYRSIEYRIPLIRCCNAGYSVVLNPKGQVIMDLPLFEEGAFTYDVPVYERRITTYARFGNWLPWILFLLFISNCIYSYLIFQKSDYIPSERKIHKKKSHKKKKK